MTINLVNIAATMLLVLMLNFGITGAAIASVIAEATGVLLGMLGGGAPGNGASAGRRCSTAPG